jgi:tetratricopeptide (TPR) repeat protein
MISTTAGSKKPNPNIESVAVQSDTESNLLRLYEAALALHLKNNLVEAENIYIKILGIAPNNTATLTNMGTLCIQTNRPIDAEKYLRDSLAIEPKQPQALNNLGTISNNQNKSSEAVVYYEKAITLDPNYTDAINNLGLSLYSQHQFSQAIPHFKRVLEINPHYPDVHNHLGACYAAIKDLKLAEQNFRSAIALNPQHASANLNLGFMRLLQGDLEAGLPLYEWRWHDEQAKIHIRQFTQPVWLGNQNLAGKTILLHPEQGLGDFIQFCRYALDLEELGAKVILAVKNSLLPLAQTLSDQFICIQKDLSQQQFDFHCPLASLPMLLGTRVETIPAYKSYLKAPPDKKLLWQQKLGKKVLPRIGIVWAGSAGHKNDWKRSIPVHLFTQLLRLNAEFHVLQKEINSKDKAILALNGVINKVACHESELHDFSDTAALIDEMDLVISVDTSIAHLTGALGKPLWLLISYLPDFRWLLDREDSPWYPSAKLFRQTQVDDWKEVTAKMQAELTKWLKNPKSNPIQFKEKLTLKTHKKPARAQSNLSAADKALLEKATQLHIAKQLDEAEKIYKQLLAKNQNCTQAISALGTICLQRSQPDEAKELFKKSLALNPKQPVALCNLGVILSESGHKNEAIASYKAAITLAPNFTEAFSNLGGVLAYLEQNEEALYYCKRAVEMKPDYIDANFNLAVAYYKSMQFEEAEIAFKKTITLNPNHAGAHLNLGYSKLLQGDLENGLPLYEWRWYDQQANEKKHHFKQPLWLGKEDINGKTILLDAEQGLGDCIHFCRYALEVEKLGAKVIIAAHGPLINLIQSLSKNFTYMQENTPTQTFDFHCPLVSLPLAFNTRLETIPAKVPYLSAPSDKIALWQQKLVPKARPRIGIVWSGTAHHKNDRNRSIPLQLFSSLLQVDAEFHVLQKETRPSDVGVQLMLATYKKIQLHQHDLHDFTDTAALINEMDLIISVDTSVAHLAGAMGKPVWVMLQYVPDFRWLLDRDDSPWYPTARLFRQTTNGDWADVIERIGLALDDFFLGKLRINHGLLNQPLELNIHRQSAQIDEAIKLHSAEKFEDAKRIYLAVLKSAPNHTEVLTLLATLYFQLDNLESSQLHFEKALNLDNTNVLTLHNYGLLLAKLNRFDDALQSINAALALNPQYEEAYKNKVILLKKMGEQDAIIETYQCAVSHIPQAASLHNKLYHHLHDAKRYDEALLAINQFIALDSTVAEAYNNRGNTLLNLKKPKDALASYQQALAIKPDYAHAHANAGNANLALNRYQDALSTCEAALKLKPALLSALNSRANALGKLRRFDEALSAYSAIIEADANNHFAVFNKGLLHLLMGDYKVGWPLYEARWQAVPLPKQQEFFTKPMWLGQESLVGKVIFLHSEQGYGDIMQFCRYAQLLIKRGAGQVYVTAHKVLYKLLLDSFSHNAETRNVIVITDGDVLPQFDYQCPLLSLPLAFDTQLNSIPAPAPYLFANDALKSEWQARLKSNATNKPKVGLVWSGSQQHLDDNNRSVPFALLANILALDMQFHCLQKDISPADKADFKNLELQSHQEGLTDFAETAALINEMDLVITVDTAVAHLAGAMGKPVWVLLQNIPDFRWLLDRDDSPWYPTAKLFRQSKSGDWTDVIKRVYQALKTEFKLT